MAASQPGCASSFKRIEGMKPSLCIRSCFDCVLERFKIPETQLSTIEADPGTPLSTIGVPGNTGMTGCVGLAASHILLILRWCGLSKVAPFITGADAVNMIYLRHRPFASHVEPSNAVRKVECSVNADYPIALTVRRVYRLATERETSKHAGFWIVVKHLAQTLRGKIGLSHEAVLSLIGQRPASVERTARALLF